MRIHPKLFILCYFTPTCKSFVCRGTTILGVIERSDYNLSPILPGHKVVTVKINPLKLSCRSFDFLFMDLITGLLFDRKVVL